MSGFTFVLAEKPAAAERIAYSLGTPSRRYMKGVPYYEVTWKQKKLIVAGALGHLYTLAPARRTSGWPCFTLRWQPIDKGTRGGQRHRTWLSSLETLSGGATDYVASCDLDVEGSLIAYNILKYCCKADLSHAMRAKFSTLTTTDIRLAFEEAAENLDSNFIFAGYTRHVLDWIFGVNVSRILMFALKRAGKFTLLSAGRVQSPALHAVHQREEKIQRFAPASYHEVTATAQITGRKHQLQYSKGTIRSLAKALAVKQECDGKNGVVTEVKVNTIRWPSPFPFDLGSLQLEAYRLFRYTPARTLRIAESLYLRALISYPRTSSQKLPPSIGYLQILQGLSNNPNYKPLIDMLLSETPTPRPREGKKSDPAHPAIYPTGNLPKTTLNEEETRVLDLIVLRFLSAFSNPCLKERLRSTINIGRHEFFLLTTRTSELGWLKYYMPYTHSQDDIFPDLATGDTLEICEIRVFKMLTSPPPRYTPASLLRYMEHKRLGTKTTRGEVVDTLYRRGYVNGTNLRITPLGAAMVGTLARHFPELVSTELTQQFELATEKIVLQQGDYRQPILESLDLLRALFHRLINQLDEVSESLREGLEQARKNQSTLGPCPKCRTGTLQIIKSKRSGKRFAGCSMFFEGKCSFAAPLPQRGAIHPSSSPCPTCTYPRIIVRRTHARPWTLCLNLNCPAKRNRGQYDGMRRASKADTIGGIAPTTARLGASSQEALNKMRKPNAAGQHAWRE